MDDRDFPAEMYAVVDAELGAPQVVVPLLAKDLTDKLRANDPELLAGWLDVQAPQILGDYIGRRLASRRQVARVQEKRTAFGAAAERFESGDRAAVSSWLETKFLTESGAQKALGAFEHADLTFAKDVYGERAAANAFESHFFAALAKKVTTGTVADHYTDEQIAAMRSSLKDA